MNNVERSGTKIFSRRFRQSRNLLMRNWFSFMTIICVVQQVLTLANFDLVNSVMDDLRGIIR